MKTFKLTIGALALAAGLALGATNWPNRYLIIIPAAQQAGMNAWAKANYDPGTANLFYIGLSSTGDPPATHYWISMALTDAELKAFSVKVYGDAAIPFPANWDTATLAEKRGLYIAREAMFKAKSDQAIKLSDNTGTRDNPDDVLATAGLKRLPQN